MTPASTLSILLEESAAVFESSGYSLFNIEAYIVCLTVLFILLFCQQNSSDQTESRIIWGRLLLVQIFYCFTGAAMVLVDINILPKSDASQYIASALNSGAFSLLCWLTFVYIDACQKSELLSSLRIKILTALPFIFNIIHLFVSPLTGSVFEISEGTIRPGILFPLMITINLAYPSIAVIFALIRRRHMGRYERDNLSIVAIYPLFFIVFGPVQALNWKIPFLCYAIMIADIFVYINYADSLVSVDPLTKIPNRNGLIQNLSAKLAGENTEGLYLFAIDIDDLSGINSTFGRYEGDKALTLIAGALKKFRDEEHPCYISRYYSDEFIITSNIENEEARELFIEHIRNYISNAVMSSGIRYLLRVNIGYSKYEQYSKTETIAGLIDEADKMLEENKEQRRFNAIWKTSRSSE